MNEHYPKSHRMHKPYSINVRINHPKLINIPFHFQSNITLQELQQEVTSNTLLQLFSNYRFEIDGQTYSNKKQLHEIVNQHASHLQIDIVFQHYMYSSAMHHYREVAQILAHPYQLSHILRPQHNLQSQIVDPEKLGSELLNHSFKINKSSIEDIVSPNFQGQFWNNIFNSSPQLLHFITLSGFVPPPQAQLSGDFFYLHAKTLENNDIHITACPLGFHINQSKINAYNPSPVPGKHIYTSLLDLLCACSERFYIAFAKLANPNEMSLLDKLLMKQDTAMAIVKKKPDGGWLQKNDQEHQWNLRKDYTVKEIQTPISSSTDWNQLFLEIETRAQRMRQNQSLDSISWESDALRKAYLAFEEAAKEGAKKIVDGKLQAMNHADQKKRHIYVYDRIFFSLTQDTLLHHIIQKGDDMVPTGTSVNTDLINLSELIRIRPSCLHILHTVLVNYRGQRIIAQTILPGLLSTQLSVLTQYGSVDQNKSIHNNPQFHKLLLPICRELDLQECVFALDKQEKVVQVAISPQIKGIRSSNGELYICDLQRMSPRDLNYPGLQNEGCVLRREIIKQYIHQKHKESYNLINPNIDTSIKYQPNEKTTQQQRTLKAIATYLKQQAIPKLANALKSKTGGDYLTDSQGLSLVFHSHGINMRYLGEVQKHELLSDSVQVRTCLIRGILVRTLKNIFRNALRKISPLLISTTIAHMLNCLFAKKNQIIQLIGNQNEQKQQTNEPKRKKKKKQKEEQCRNVTIQEHHYIKIENSHYHNIKPQDLWRQVCEVAKARYDYVFEANLQLFAEIGLFRLVYQKYATLRDLCQCIGLILQKKDYKLRQTDIEQSLPFTAKNILGFYPKTKKPLLFSTQIQETVALADKFFAQSQFPQSLKTYEQAVNIMRQRKQGQKLSHCLGQISRIHYMLGRLRDALNIQASNLAFILKSYREDSFQAVRCYSRLGLYCMSLGVWQSALWLLGKGLHLMLMCFGQTYPDVLVNLANIARVYQLNREIQAASGCYLKAIELLAIIHRSRSHINASFCFSSLASLYYETGQYKKSIEYQTETVNILLKTLPTDDPRNVDAQKILKVYKQIYQTQPGRSIEHRQRKK